MGRGRNWILVTWGQRSARPRHHDRLLVVNPSFLYQQPPPAQAEVTFAANPSTFAFGPDQGQARRRRGMRCRCMGMVGTFWSIGTVEVQGSVLCD